MSSLKKLVSPRHNSESNGVERKPVVYGFRALLGLGTIAVIVLLFPISSIYETIILPAEGSIAKEDVIAPFTFPVLKGEEELNRDKELVLSDLSVILDYHGLKGDSVAGEVEAFFARVDSINQSNRIPESRTRSMRLAFPHLEEEGRYLLSTSDDLGPFRSNLLLILNEFYQTGMVEKTEDLPFAENRKALILKGNEEISISEDQLLDISKARERLLSLALVKFEHDQLLVKATYEIGSRFLVANLTLSPNEMETRRQAALEAVTQHKGMVLKGEIILAKNQKVAREDLERLYSLSQFRIKTGLKSDPWHFVFPLLGRIFFAGAVILGLALFLYFVKPSVFFDNRKFAMIVSTLVLEMILTYLILFRWQLSEYLIPVAIASMALTILLDVEVGLVFTFCLGILLGVVNYFDFKLAFITIVAGSLACFSVKEVAHRYRFYRPMLYVSFAYVVFIYFSESLKLSPSGSILSLCGYGLFNGFISTILTIGLLPIFESLFDVTTDITLLELSDLNHPLLKRLSLEAPGTYHHSIIVGNLAEAGAKAIGANTLLARVGAYYHDIGKVDKPEYFVENQMGAKSKHEKLTPSMSALILESHVKEGVEMAEEVNLPQAVVDFIHQHHGTTVMRYFYNKALEQGAGQDLKDEYRYPGPRPHSRETAIVMLADAVEAASRVLEDPKPSRIKSLIKKIIDSKLEAGELSDSDLTFKELGAVEQAFLPVLISVFHPRVEYPETAERPA
ncbi:MAG: HDIG domain-containing protein [Candidatus Zixiibacteriota bacterium]|nr:MAG: HDIG domain-containing protein [candidate division Zixibacteria bacterium]